MSGKQASTRIVPSKLEHVVNVFIVHLTFIFFPKYIFLLVSPAPLGGGSKGKPCMKRSSNSYALLLEEYLLKSLVTKCAIKEKIKTLRKYVLAFSSKIRKCIIPEDINLVRLFNLRNCFGYLSRAIIK